jgi:plastocyanin
MRAALLIAPAAALLSFVPSAAAAPRTHTVVIDKMKFAAMPAGVKAGDAIVWVNRDVVRHTASAANGAFDVDLEAGESARAVVRKSGATAVTCKYHPGMRALLRVAAR